MQADAIIAALGDTPTVVSLLLSAIVAAVILALLIELRGDKEPNQ